MNELSQAHCEACTAETPRVNDEELKELMILIPDWNIEIHNNVMQLHRAFKFKNFVTALDFTNKIAAIAEAQNHHPSLLTEWGKVSIAWWTHSVQGLHRNDFIMAAKTNLQYSVA